MPSSAVIPSTALTLCSCLHAYVCLRCVCAAWFTYYKEGLGQIGTGANRRNCLTIDPNDGGKGVMR